MPYEAEAERRNHRAKNAARARMQNARAYDDRKRRPDGERKRAYPYCRHRHGTQRAR